MKNNKRQFNFVDRYLINFDQMVRTLLLKNPISTRPNPAHDCLENKLTEQERRYAAGLMRVNHTGEVCAQALYQGQALTARDPAIQVKLTQAAQEENDHLAWCAQRLSQLSSHTSFLNPLWYMGSLSIGITAGLIGDKINLGFLVETERQVEQHLTEHLDKLPPNDVRSRKIVEQMRTDEAQHAQTATHAGAAELPAPVRLVMRGMSKLMTKTTFWV